MQQARLAVSGDLDGLMELFDQAPFSNLVTPIERAREIWEQTLAQEGVFVFVSDEESQIVATCMLITAPNLLREGRKHAYIDNVATRTDFQRRGHGKAVMRAAIEMAWAENCFHVMLQSGRQDPGIHRFYEECGFEGGLRTAFVARYRVP